jgi:gamma-glutamylcyclotransferase (GGCT)/AIG2-like uncharacterized protein YtfP
MAESHRAVPLFAYGTLMFPAIVESILGRIPDRCSATIEGFRRLEVAGELFPGLVKDGGHKVEGVLYLSLSQNEWELLTAFEDDFYVLEEVTVFSSGKLLQALAFLVPPSRRSVLTETVWDPDSFRKNHLALFLRPRHATLDQNGKA